VKKNITLLYGFSCFDQFMIVIALWVPYLATKGIGMRLFMELQAVFALVILCGGEKSSGTAVLGNAQLAAQTGTTVSALVGGAVVTLSYGHLLWANAILSWIPVLLVLRLTEPPATLARGKKRAEELKEMLSRSVGGLRSHRRPRRAGRSSRKDEIRPATLARRGWRVAHRRAFRDGVFPRLGRDTARDPGPVGRGLGKVLFLEALNERISSAFRATVISMANLGIRASFCLLGPLVGYGIDAWGLPSVLSALGILFSIAFVVLLLPLVLRETSLRTAEGVTR